MIVSTHWLPAITGGMIVLFGLLWAYVRLYQQEQEKSRELEASIARRKQAEEELRESEARLKRSQAMAHLGSWELDVVNDVLTWSDEVYRIFGLKPQEFKATYGAFLEAVHPDDRQAVDDAYSGSLREGRDTYEIEHRIVGKSNGEVRSVHEKCEHFRDQSGRIIRSIGMVHDITERKRHEYELRQAKDNLEARVKERTTELEKAKEAMSAERQRLYDVLETLPVYVCLLDSDYHMPFANRYFRETFGESQGRRCYEFLFDRTEPCETCETCTVMKTRAPHHWYWTGPNGRDYDIYDFPFIDTDGSFLILEMGIDITERKQAEDALRETLADLTRSNRDLEYFAYVASHDLQEPLRNVASTLQMLEKRQKGKLDGESSQLIYYAVDSARKMKALITDLLTYSRLTTRGKPFQAVDIQNVLDQSLHNVKSLIVERGAEVTHDEMPTVMGDATQLLQVFQNLIGNAVEFGPSQSPKIHVSVRSRGNEWIFSVKDNGIGIDGDYFDRIFVIFQQLSKKVPHQGTGMGLAIVKKIVERHRGRVWVESQVGSGSTFYFTIPEGLEA
jgi:PAS domain S-box-containing protein